MVGERAYVSPDADELLRYLEGVSRTNYARASLDDSKEVTTFARFGQRCVNCEAASSPPSLSTPASTPNVKGNETRVNEGSTRRGWRREKCAARRARRERRGALKVTIFLRSKVMARNCRHRRNDRRRVAKFSFIGDAPLPTSDGERSNDNSLHINVFVPVERYLYNRNGCWDR